MDNSWLFTLMSNSVFVLFIQLTVILIMFTVALRMPLTLKSPLFRAGLLARSLLSVIVLVPLALLVLILILEPLGVTMPTILALIVLAAAPGAPLLTVRVLKAGGDFQYAVALQVVVSLLATITVPLTLLLFAQLLPVIPEDAVQPVHVLKIVVIIQLIPIILGMVIRAIRASFADWLVKWVAKVSKVMMLALLLVVIVAGFPSLFSEGILSLIAVILFVIACLVIGHLFGGPGIQFKSTLAIGTLARNIGLALLIIGINKAVAELLPPIIAFLIVGFLLGLAYSALIKKRIAQAGGSDEAAEK